MKTWAVVRPSSIDFNVWPRHWKVTEEEIAKLADMFPDHIYFYFEV